MVQDKIKKSDLQKKLQALTHSENEFWKGKKKCAVPV